MNLIFLTYLGWIVFGIAAGVRIYKQITMPLHVCWELYPVKHEAGKRAEYGGWYMEEPNWWEKKRERLVNGA